MTQLRILVVEDSETMAEAIIKRVSEPRDDKARVIVVTTAKTEDDAIAACDRATFDVAIIDLQLAAGTGFGVLRRLAREKPTPLRIVFTSYAVPALKVAAFEAGADFFLDKSRDLSRLAAIAGEGIPLW